MNTTLERVCTAGGPRRSSNPVQWGLVLIKVRLAEPRCSAPLPARRGPRRSTRSPALGPGLQRLRCISFLQWIHFLDAKHLYLLVLPFKRCLWLVCFELHYRLECNCGESIFMLLRVAANHSYMLQRIYNCLVLCVHVFNCIWEVLWRRICVILNL